MALCNMMYSLSRLYLSLRGPLCSDSVTIVTTMLLSVCPAALLHGHAISFVLNCTVMCPAQVSSECLEAIFYNWAAFGQNVPPSLKPGPVTGVR